MYVLVCGVCAMLIQNAVYTRVCVRMLICSCMCITTWDTCMCIIYASVYKLYVYDVQTLVRVCTCSVYVCVYVHKYIVCVFKALT